MTKIYTGQDYEDLKYALGLLEVGHVESFKETSDTGITLAVGKSKAQVVSDGTTIRSWLRATDQEDVRWFGITQELWSWLEFYLELDGDPDFLAEAESGLVYHAKNDVFIRHLRVDLGGQDFGQPIFLFLMGDSYRASEYDRWNQAWFGKDPGKLIERVRAETAELKASSFALRPAVNISPNVMSLIIRRLSRLPSLSLNLEGDDNETSDHQQASA